MTLQIVLAVVHLLALALGLPAVLLRARALAHVARAPADRDALGRAFAADGMWGAAAALWIGSGLWRWLAGTEKSTDYYVRNHFFLAKMGVLLVVLLLEVWPMVKLMGWRVAVRGGAAAEPVATPEAARRIVAVSYVQSVLVVLMVIFAVSMARGLGAMPGG
jgi:putative membrane protein